MSTEANVKLLEKIGKVGKDTSKLKVPTTRLNDNFRNILLESGFDKKATADDVKKGFAVKKGQKIGSFTAFNNYLGKINPDLTVFSNDPKTMVKVTNELNKVRGNLGLPKYTNVGITTPRSVLEQTTTGTKYAEAGSKIPKEKVQKTLLEAQLKADKKFGVTPDGKAPTKKKLNFMAKYIQGKLGKTLTLSGIISLITKSGFGKAIPGVNVLSYAYDAGNIGQEYGPPVIEKVQEGLDTVTEPVASKMTQAEDMIKQMFLSKMNEGGMMDINYMTRPLGYKEGTREGELVGDREKTRFQEKILRDVFDKKTGPDGKVDFGQFSSEELKMLFNVSPEVGLFAGLRDFAKPEVMKAAGERRGVDTIQLASDYLRSLQMGLSGNEEAMNAMIDILNTTIVPEEQLKLIKEGQSDLGRFGQKVGSGLESLYQKLPDALQIFGKQEPGEGKIQTMDDRTLEELRKLYTR